MSDDPEIIGARLRSLGATRSQIVSNLLSEANVQPARTPRDLNQIGRAVAKAVDDVITLIEEIATEIERD